VGLTDNTNIFIPVEETDVHIVAARQATIRHNERILGAITEGGYSGAYLREQGRDRPIVQSGDFDLISLPTDFLGMNIYFGQFVRAARQRPGYEVLSFPQGYPATTLSGWLKTTPQAMYWGTHFAAELYRAKAIYITENGYGAVENVNEKGELIDLHRRDYLRQYLIELHRAIGDGVPVKGYFAWSWMDNFEWADGYSTRFGLCHTDYQTLQRTPKLSALWYASVMRENRIV
jgi:beta-glucosidase